MRPRSGRRRWRTADPRRRLVVLPPSPGVPQIAGQDLLFSTNGRRSVSGFSKASASIVTLSGVNDYRLHDLRRTVRTNLSRLGVAADVAEMVLGHRLTGVRKIYDRHDFLKEKRAALEVCAKELKIILNRKDS